MSRISRRSFLAASTLGLYATGCGGEQAEAPTNAPAEPAAKAAPLRTRARKPDITIVIMDTARRDCFSSYGSVHVNTPVFDEISKGACRYSNAYSTGAWTVPAHASLFTGLFPIAHGATQENLQLGGGLTTLAEALANNGYQTLAIAENAMLLEKRGFGQGFQVYHEAFRNMSAFGGKSPALTLLKKEIGAKNSEAPLFTFINLIAPHTPYQAPDLFRKQRNIELDSKLHKNSWRDFYLGRKVFSESELKSLREEYNAEILYTDHLVGEIVDVLQSANRWDNSVFFLAADHGENIGDHGHMDHVFNLYQTLIYIPMLVRGPECIAPGKSNDAPVQLHDIFPTALAAAGVDAEAYPNHGVSLLAEDLPRDRTVFAEYYEPKQAIQGFKPADRDHPALKKFRRRIRTVIRGNHKLVWGSDGANELYDLQADPDENNNLMANAPEGLAESLGSQLDTFVTKFAVAGKTGGPATMITDDLDDETIESLKAIGYLE